MLLATGIAGALLGSFGAHLFLHKSSLGQRMEENCPPAMAKLHKALFVVASAGFVSSSMATAATYISGLA